MVQRMAHYRKWILASLVWALIFALPGCVSVPDHQVLRITNRSGRDIPRLVVMFPDERIDFGAIPAGATSEYKPVPRGVYSYAAYEVDLNGATIRQPVTDWVGEKPMVGLAFTYTIDVDPAQGPARNQVILLLEVKRDRP